MCITHHSGQALIDFGVKMSKANVTSEDSLQIGIESESMNYIRIASNYD